MKVIGFSVSLIKTSLSRKNSLFLEWQWLLNVRSWLSKYLFQEKKIRQSIHSENRLQSITFLEKIN